MWVFFMSDYAIIIKPFFRACKHAFIPVCIQSMYVRQCTVHPNWKINLWQATKNIFYSVSLLQHYYHFHNNSLRWSPWQLLEHWKIIIVTVIAMAYTTGSEVPIVLGVFNQFNFNWNNRMHNYAKLFWWPGQGVSLLRAHNPKW